MMTIGLPVRREKELAEVFVETYCPLSNHSKDWKWELADEFCRNNIRAATRAVIEEAFRRLEENHHAICREAHSRWRIDGCMSDYAPIFLRACKQFLLAGLTDKSANGLT